MEYNNLKKLYYEDSEKWKKEYEKRFNSEDAVHLDFDIGGKPAFFLQNKESFYILTDILKLDKEICKLCGALPGVAIDQFKLGSLIDEIVVTNKIEGVHSTRKELFDTLDELDKKTETRGERKRFEGLLAKYIKLARGDETNLTTCEDVRALYDELVLEEVLRANPKNLPDGKIFRKDAASVNTSTEKELHRGIYPEKKIIQYMNSALAFLSEPAIQPLFRISVFHYLLEYIHPFYDGNGRLGRYIVSLMISKELEPLLAYRLSNTIFKNLSKYYDAFEICNAYQNMGDATPFLLMMLEMIKLSAEELKNSLETKIKQWKRYRQHVVDLPKGNDQRRSLIYDLLIQAYLFSEYGIKYEEIEHIAKCSYATLKKELDEIEKEGYLIIKKNGRTKHFSLDLTKMDDLIISIDS